MKAYFNRLMTLFVAMSSLSGCGTLYRLDVTAVGNGEYSGGRTYVILPGDPSQSVSAPQFRAWAAILERALTAQDFERRPDGEAHSADLGIYLLADISEPRTTVYQTRQAVFEERNDDPAGRSRTTGRGSVTPGGASTGATAADPEPQPETELIGAKMYGFERKVYTKYLSIIAVDLRQYYELQQAGDESKVPAREVWSTDVRTTGSSSSLDEVIPVMVAAAEPFLGTNQGKTLRVTLDETDARISRIRGEK